MTPKKESHFNMPRAIPAPTGIPVVEPSGKQVLLVWSLQSLFIFSRTPVTLVSLSATS